MSQHKPSPVDPSHTSVNIETYPHFSRDALRKIIPYWRSDEKKTAWGLFTLVILFTIVVIGMQVALTYWNNRFFNALQNYDAQQFLPLIRDALLILVTYLFSILSAVFAQTYLSLRWRRWMTRYYLDLWLNERSYYLLQFLGNRVDNPDQRLAEDIRIFTDETLALFKVFLTAIITLASFCGVLWGLSGAITIMNITIPGYLVWIALLYAIGGTICTHYLTRSLVPLEFQRERYEGDFRFALARVREYSESIALYGGEKDERQLLKASFQGIYSNYIQIIKKTLQITTWISGYMQLSAIVPLLAAAPKYLAKQINLGQFIQISASFQQVEKAFSVIVESFPKIVHWKASTLRLLTFEKTLREVEGLVQETKITYCASPQQHYAIKDLNINRPDGTRLLSGLNQTFKQGESVLIMAPSGEGKSTLLKVITSLWPFAEGTVERPETTPFFLPQKPYLPLGTLGSILRYPQNTKNDHITKEQLESVLEQVGLEHLSDQLDVEKFWSHILSLGEQQRLGFARLLLQRPAWAFLDEATSSLDEEAERELYKHFIRTCPETTIISIGHRSTLKDIHQRVWILPRDTPEP